jgi:Zn-dependent protease with chaperone function
MTLPILSATFGFLLFSSPAQSQYPLDRALSTLIRTDANTFWAELVRSRPQPVPAEFKAGVLAGLPPKGEVQNLKKAARGKLAAVQPILRIHGRDSVHEVKVIDVPGAFVGLHARSVILISEAALNLLSAEELQASVAHEAGHEYVWLNMRRPGSAKILRACKNSRCFVT